jgi:hypothetical protein
VKLNQILDKRPQSTEQLTTGSNTVRTIDNCTIVDRALIQTADLITEDFKPWYAKQAYRLGADRYLGIASDARRGRSPQKLFSYLLRRS